MKKLLLIEDDIVLSKGICLAIATDELLITPCYDLHSAKIQIQKESFDLIVLDINLPDGNGLVFLKECKKTYATPIILLTANDMERDVVMGLELGADDYITKPFRLPILRARIHTQLRKPIPSFVSSINIGAYHFDFERMDFFKGSTLLSLSKTEQKLLRLLIQNRGQTLTRELLIDRIWTDSLEYVDENALSVTINRLRNKLEDSPNHPNYIKTIYGIGYMWAEEAT